MSLLSRCLNLFFPEPAPSDPPASMTPSERAAFDQGYEATHKDQNPYQPGTALHAAWDMGFQAYVAVESKLW
ncbi:hypothetical protein [Burkholderia cepacia]|uniref:hypothetical protein n=1 Tax=Burkholderia cepacia TaxID=292 RepID=UPI001F2A0CBD|nr:hypothetical protein [Burkholderia cepacia]MCE4125361.1 hypothetical protein [Burkholderia cepacia]